MEENEYYMKNKHKIDFLNKSTWKYFPIGNNMRKTYDYYYTPLIDFLERYYTSFEREEHWNDNWLNAIVLPAFDGDNEKLSKLLGAGILNKFSRRKMIDFYNKYKSDNIFDDDILLFISWMAGMNFFKDIGVDFCDWINSKNNNVGGRHEVNEDRYSLKEMSNEKHGMNLIRDKLMNLEWHKR